MEVVDPNAFNPIEEPVLNMPDLSQELTPPRYRPELPIIKLVTTEDFGPELDISDLVANQFEQHLN